MKVKDVYDFINSRAPFSRQESYDNSGLIVGNMEREVKKICLALDATNEAVNEAAEAGADLMITHHPTIFHAIKSVDENSPVYGLIKHGISLISAHTSYDAADRGVTDLMLELLRATGLSCGENAETLDEIGNGYGIGRIVTLDFVADARSLAEICKKAFGCKVVRYTDTERPLKRIAVSSGSGGSFIGTAREKGCDCLISGDFKWENIVEASNGGLALVDAGHFYTENILCAELLKLFSTEFPSVECFMAKASRDLCQYVI